jgi:hypothetical protein
LIDELVSGGVGLTLEPIVEAGLSFGHDEAAHVAGWEIQFKTYGAVKSFAFRGTTIADAVEQAWKHASTWR